jgi:glycosyltransferase involved in cell wall biosynthesis
MQRFKIGIVFNLNPNWMGGIVYILNLIRILDFLDDQDKPEILLFYRKDLKTFVEEIKYPYLKAIEWDFPSVYKGYLHSWISGKNVFVDKILRQYDPDGLYPLHDFPLKQKTRTKLVSWYADLQHMHYPEFFSWKKIIERNVRIRFMLRNSSSLVVSSQAVADDFARFFKPRKKLKLYVFHFVSVIDVIDGINIEGLKTRYRLPDRYFMISNQFHKHKNHRALIKALAILKEKGESIHLVFTGKFPDKTHSPYIEELHKIINDCQLKDHISFIGVIPRNEQLVLMKYSQAVIQPSLFEGWSTVIEDARSLQVPVIASSIPVNIEQLGPDNIYFEPHDHEKLADILCNFPERNFNDVFYSDYKTRVRNAANTFVSVFQS